jgi:hypothetical protein
MNVVFPNYGVRGWLKFLYASYSLTRSSEPLIVPMWEKHRISEDLSIREEVDSAQYNPVEGTWRELLRLWCPICLDVECIGHSTF